ncbi:sterile alpha motif domain-containing protein 9-like [Scleropages formosus]|uniref:Sterile alpha motif domain-containing protein 9-like n=1 Tax=Scleropages formosus TaxID=113540 RepID=A0A0P7Z9A0_SCLFO|nr:sterile alpha motif domain-containing protein 9-like [Scleropages formosus]
MPVEKWTESHVSSWLKSIGVKEHYIQKLHEEEVNGQILLELTEDYLRKETGMKSGPALLIIRKRNELINSQQEQKPPKVQKKQQSGPTRESEGNDVKEEVSHLDTDAGAAQTLPEPKTKTSQRKSLGGTSAKTDCKPRPFGNNGVDFTYVKHNVLFPESGIIDLISPCHEYKSFSTAATLDRQRLQAKFAREVLKFGTGCMNIRSNGTIHFGVMDSREDAGFVHGEIIGLEVKDKDIYVDALDYTERCFSSSDSEHVRWCIRPPVFIEVVDINSTVVDINSTEKRYIVEVDIVPAVSIVRNRVYSVRLPNFREKSNKVEFEKDTIYRRVGSKTEPVSDQNEFYQRVKDRDVQREEAEQANFLTAPDISEDLGRKLTVLVTSGKKVIEKEKWYILVTNKFQNSDLSNIDFLLNMKIFCVFDFDTDSKRSGFCSKYLEHHAANLHFLQNYKIPSGMSIRDFESHLHLFEQTSWIFCNGRSDFRGNEVPCDEMMWIKTKITLLRESVSLICKQILPKGSFLVIFLLTSPVEKPILHTFYEFFTEMEGHEDIICISESEENYQKWESFSEASCDTNALRSSSVVGMKMSHVNATLQRIQPLTTRTTKHLAVFTKGECLLETREEERMYSLEILGVDQCDGTTEEFIEEEKERIESYFYQGGKVSWLNFWLAEKKYVGEVIQRDAYREVSKLLCDIPRWNVESTFISRINIYHHPGSGGSTVARQVLWNNRKELRCAVVKPSYSTSVVSEHAVQLREYEEKDPQKCLPVLLLVEDCDNEFLDDLRNELDVAINTKRVTQGTLCFILLSCKRSHNPEKMSKESPLRNVAVTHKLSAEEKREFSGKRKMLEKHYQPEFILTFVLMTEEFDQKYVTDFVEHLLQDIDHTSIVTRLILYVALLNSYVQNSFISQSHCEALLSLTIHMDRFRQHTFERSLNEQAKLVFIHLRDEKTYIQSIRIIHPLVAKEILQQLLGNDKQQSSIAMDFLKEDVLYEHRFGKEEYVKFLRALFMRRYRISKGDESDSFFSPLIEHVKDQESPEKALELLEAAYSRFNKDAFFAQQLARLSYSCEKFEEAEQWAEVAVRKMPQNSYILDTKGQVYRRWFMAKCKTLEKVTKTPENTAGAIETALKAMECFKMCEKAAVSDLETMNNSGFFAAVEVGCNLLKLIFSLRVFSSKTECQKYLLTEYIPEEVKKPWERFHNQLKSLQLTMHEALEWISEDLSYFQTDVEEEETVESTEMKINNPKNWLVNKSSVYGKYFTNTSLSSATQMDLNQGNLTPFMKRMAIYHLGGGNITTIFALLADQKDKGQIKVLENIISLYPSNPLMAKLNQTDLVNYIATQIALGCLSTQSPKLASLHDLRHLCQQFPSERTKCLSSALFLVTLLFWPEEEDNVQDRENKYGIVMSAVEYLKGSYLNKMKDIPRRKRRIFTHFFLGNGRGWNKIIHKSKVETITKLLSVSEKRMKWLRGEVWKMPEIAKQFRTVQGWTEDGTVYLDGPQKKKFMIPALNSASIPYGNENVTFYLGFTFRGPVAYNITVKQ